jgi:hypothetical protein
MALARIGGLVVIGGWALLMVTGAIAVAGNSVGIGNGRGGTGMTRSGRTARPMLPLRALLVGGFVALLLALPVTVAASTGPETAPPPSTPSCSLRTSTAVAGTPLEIADLSRLPCGGAIGLEPERPPAQVVLECRGVFVVTDIKTVR